ncbi:MAG: hypothetical protein ABJI96_04385 [Paracoccaceae bacterium]
MVILVGQYVVVNLTPHAASSYPLIALGLGFFLHGVVFVWQIVGVLRAGEAHIRALGSITDMWGAQLGILVAVWVVISDSWGLWLASYPVSPDERYVLDEDSDQDSLFTLMLAQNGKSVSFSGEIARGSTKAVAAFLMDYPNVERMVLSSQGGNIYEARGLARLARDHSLDTYVANVCSSACTLAFIGGTTRKMASDAKLGFHQYRVDAYYTVPFADPEAEEAKDRALFEHAGVAEWFLDRMFVTQADSMWFPSAGELLDANVVTTD